MSERAQICDKKGVWHTFDLSNCNCCEVRGHIAESRATSPKGDIITLKHLPRPLFPTQPDLGKPITGHFCSRCVDKIYDIVAKPSPVSEESFEDSFQEEFR